MRKILRFSLWLGILLGLPASCFLVEGKIQNVALTTGVTLHHVHLNSRSPATAMRYYADNFADAHQTAIAGWDAVQSGKVWLLFNAVTSTPEAALTSPLWHFGWGSLAMETDYQKFLNKGLTFATPLTRLTPNFLFAYLQAPDGALVEINTASSTAFTHIHLMSAAPLCTAQWYIKHFGASFRGTFPENCQQPYAAPSEPLGVIRSPTATVRLGEISLIIYPQQNPGQLESPRGHVFDHFALRVSNLQQTLDSLRRADVKVLKDIHPFGKSKDLAAFIAGPDALEIELVEAKN